MGKFPLAKGEGLTLDPFLRPGNITQPFETGADLPPKGVLSRDLLTGGKIWRGSRAIKGGSFLKKVTPEVWEPPLYEVSGQYR